MRWGVRRSRAEREAARSGDSAETKAIKVKTKTTGINSLSNQELQRAITRMNLERQYSNLNPSKSQRVNRVLKNLIGAGKTANEIKAFSDSPVGKDIRAGIESVGERQRMSRARANYNRSYK
jgi:hypothetical protein